MSGAPAARAAAAMFLLGPAAIHFAVVPDHLRLYPPYGLFLMVVGVLQVALAAAVLTRPGATVLLGGAAFSLLVIAIWLVSRTAGLPFGPTPGVPEPIGLPDLFATLMEWIAAILLLVADARLARHGPLRPIGAVLSLVPATVFSVLLTVVALAGTAIPSTH